MIVFRAIRTRTSYRVLCQYPENTAKHAIIACQRGIEANRIYVFPYYTSEEIRVTNVFSNTNGYKMSYLAENSQNNTSKKQYSCNLCDKSYNHRSNLSVHRRVHKDERPYICKVCNMSFTQHGDLVLHWSSHRDERPYPCGICGNTYTSSSSLRRHQHLHTDFRPHPCYECNMSFSTKAKLKQHQLKHLEAMKKHKFKHFDEKPYPCDMCEMSFVNRGNLNVHRRTHTGEKPFPCEFCNWSFAHRCNLNRHMLMVHVDSQMLNPSDVCELLFGKDETERQLVRNEVNQVHPEVQAPYTSSYNNMFSEWENDFTQLNVMYSYENKLESYIHSTDTFQTNENILYWWKDRNNILLTMAKLAIRILAIPATSAAGRVIKERRSCLKAETIDALLFLQDYQKEK
ncbi:hypothetical protein QTP88_011476 [Uroleucon formosanum]